MIRTLIIAVMVAVTGSLAMAWDNSDYWSYASYQKNVYNWPTHSEANLKYVDLGDDAELVIRNEFNGAKFVVNNINNQPHQAPRNMDWDDRLSQFEYK